MKVLLNDGMDREGIELFERAGIQADVAKRDLERLLKEIGEFDALVVRSATKVTREVLKAGSDGRLKIVGRAGVGYDNIDLDAASEYGIMVKIAPRGNTNAAAEHALALMFAVSRKIPQAHSKLQDGKWYKKDFEGVELSGKTLGIIGCGRIGQRLSQLVLGLGMKVVGYDSDLDRVKEEFPDSRIIYVGEKAGINELFDENPDYISIHVGGKREVIGTRELNKMKGAAFLINTSRGKNINEKALYDALNDRRIAGAALDVFEDEPKDAGDFKSLLRFLPNVVLTPHLGASTIEAQKKTSMEVARAVIDYFSGNYSNAINVDLRRESQLQKREIYSLFILNKDVPGVFASIDGVLAESGISIGKIESYPVSDSRGNALTVYRVYQPVNLEVIRKLELIPTVHRVRV